MTARQVTSLNKTMPTPSHWPWSSTGWSPIAREMTEAMLRTAMSQILNSSRDFSTAILDGDCQLVAQGEGIPVHISALPVAGAAVRDHFGDSISEGDLFILNDPYFGGSHLPDITIIRPHIS